MTEYISQNKFAGLCGVSRQAIGKAVTQGRVVKTTSGIDVEHPSNIYFKEKAQLRKKMLERPTKKKKKKPLVAKVTKAPPETPDDIIVSEGGPRPKGAPSPTTFDMFQKAYEETRLKKIQADLAVLKYAKEAGAVVDTGTLTQKMGAFTNFLLTHLIYLPEEISDMLWMVARSAEDPEREIRKLLNERIESIIKEAKVAAAAVEPPDLGVKYVMLGMEDDYDEPSREESIVG